MLAMMVNILFKERCSLNESVSKIRYFAGCHYWTASILPALIGTTLPFWLSPPNFSFKLCPAIEFLFATILFHSGFSFLLVGFDKISYGLWTKKRLLFIGFICLIIGCLIGFHLNSNLSFKKNLNPNIFIFFSIATIIVGFLYVAPPASLYKRVGGDIILFEGLSMIPILGAYLVQVGDLTRTVYIVSIPVMVSTALWVWLNELVSRNDDLRTGRNTMIMIFPFLLANRIVPTLLTILIYLTLIGAIIVRSSLNPTSLLGLLSFIIGYKIIRASWNSFANSSVMVKTLRDSFIIHFFICMTIFISSLLTFFHR